MMPDFIEQPPMGLANSVPSPEATIGAAGNTVMASRGDHTHPRLTATDAGTLGADGTKAITFTRSFPKKPSAAIFLDENSTTTGPVSFRITSWVQDGNGNYTGCTIFGQRMRTLPDLGIITLLTGLVAALTNYAPYTAAANAPYTATFVASSQP